MSRTQNIITSKVDNPDNYKKCSLCKWLGPRSSTSRHLKSDHPELFNVGYKKIKTATFFSEEWEDEEYKVILDGIVFSKEGRLMVRVLWNLENPLKESFQKSFEPFEKMYDEDMIDEAIENSLDRVSEKKAAARAVEMLALYREIKEDLPDLEDA
ncbi:unnamed protein product [Oikopleura dioica]|uniref:Uncharacterized protein n=1 Tax=Oikopleura dioica TaxID=34765 RepID=E4X3F2_OIKDI|nr:unnamed protein product [Oikopleura dioica]